jgi:hypothetical protein
MMEKVMSKEQQANKLVKAIINQAIEGVGPLCGAKELAKQYKTDSSYRNTEDAIDALIRWETSKSFGVGFTTGLGGFTTMPITIPADLYASWVVMARLAATIAALRGHNLSNDRVQTFVMLTMLGDAGLQIAREAGINIGKKMAMSALKQVPAKVLREINKKVGFRLLTKTGEKGAIVLVKWIPVVGGVVGGGMDAAACKTVGAAAKKSFKRAA